MKETITVKRSKDLGFTIVTNSVLKDSSLSWQAKGLYSYLVSNSHDWKFYKTEVVNHSTNGRDATNRAWKELSDAGWITSKALYENGKLSGWNHVIHCDLGRERQEPQTNGKPVRLETSMTENPLLISNNSNKTNSNNNTVSSETNFEQFWKELRDLYKHFKFSIGSKEQARKIYKKLKLNSDSHIEVISKTEKHLSNKRKILDSGEFVANPKNLSGWLNNRCWEDELDIHRTINQAPQASPPLFRGTPPLQRRKVKEFGQ